MLQQDKKAPLLTPIMRWFMLAMILANIAGMMLPMLMPIYLIELGASVAQVGLVFTITSVVILFLQIMGGWISDSHRQAQIHRHWQHRGCHWRCGIVPGT